jgi:hypothetical protein
MAADPDLAAAAAEEAALDASLAAAAAAAAAFGPEEVATLCLIHRTCFTLPLNAVLFKKWAMIWKGP